MMKSPNERSAGTLETAILVTKVDQDFENSRIWRALRDLRKGHARTLGLSGIIICDANRVMYGVDGAGVYLERFAQMLEESPCETDTQLLLRRQITHRTYQMPTLMAPTLARQERLWLRRQLSNDTSNPAALPAFLSWLAARQTETIFGACGDGPVDPADTFPPCRAASTRH